MTPAPAGGDAGDAEREREFAALQGRLRRLGQDGMPGEPERTVVVCPSLNVDPDMLARHAETLPAYEQRSLFLLFLLKRPGIRVIFVSSDRVPEPILRYYLDLVPQPGGPSARERLTLFAVDDPSPVPLAEKLLGRPELVEAIREASGGAERAFLAPYMVREAEGDLALALELPVYCPDQRFAAFGTKVGSRRLFAEVGVPHPRGREAVGTPEELREAIVALRATDPPPEAVVVKHNDAVYGEGNAILRLDALPPQGATEEPVAVDRLVAGLGEEYLAKLAADPGIVEEMIAGDVASPSAQVRTIAGGSPGLVSTHDQVLGGELGQTYTGASFPARVEYGPAIAREAERLRSRLAAQGLVGRFGVDFVVAPRGDEWETWAIEINLREGGTTHPFGALYLLTDARYDPADGACRTPEGAEKHYAASDLLVDERLLGAGVEEVTAAVADAGLAWDPSSGTGAVLHMLGALEREGKCGATVIGGSAAEADELYRRLVAALGDLGERRSRR